MWRDRLRRALDLSSSVASTELRQARALLRAYAADRRGTARGITRLPALAVLASIGACTLLTDNGLSNWNPFSARGERAVAELADAPFPNLAEVPDRPVVTARSVRARVTEGLIADRTNARYTAQAIRLQGQTERTVPRPRSADLEPAAGGPRPDLVSPPPDDGAQAQAAPAVAPPVVPTPPQVAEAAMAPAAPVQKPVPPPAEPQVAVAEPVMPGADDIVIEAAPAAVQAPAAVALPAQLQLATIYFAHNSSRLNQQDMEILRQVAAVQRQYGGSLHVVGHASGRTGQLDSLRHRMVNLQISLNRASAVAQALSRLGVPPTQLMVDASGDRQPIYAETMPTGEAGNRRAEVYLIR